MTRLFLLLCLLCGCTANAATLFDGELMVLHVDLKDGTAQTIFQLETDDGGVFELTGNTGGLPLMSEIGIEVLGEKVGEAIQVETFNLAVDVEAEQVRRDELAVERRAVAVIVDFPTKKASTTPAATASLAKRMDDYYKAASYGAMSVPAGAVYGPFTVSVNETACSYSSASSLARSQAVKAGMGTYQHEMYILPTNIGCGWLGLAYVGCQDRCTLWTSSPDNLTVLAHEFGHNIGMHHSSRDADDNCTVESEYGDHSCVMGNYFDKAVGLNAPHVVQKNWAPAVEHKAPADYSMAPLAASEGTRIVRWPRAKGGHYYVAYRGAVSNDAGLKPEFANKVNVYHWSGSAQTRFITAIGVGQTVNVGGTPVTFKSLNGSVALVNVGGGGSTPPPQHLGTLKVQHSQKCMTRGLWERIFQQPCDGTERQKFTFVASAMNGVYLLKSSDGKCLDVGGGSWSDGATIYLTGCHGRQNQLWKPLVQPNDPGVYLIMSHAGASKKCLAIEGGSVVDGARLTQYGCAGVGSQKFGASL